MKKIISLLSLIAIMLSMSITVLAGSIPEDLLHSDDAQIFFAEVLSIYEHTVELSPVKKIKGNIKTGTKQHYQNPNIVGNFKVRLGNVYLFTCFDENNPTDIFEVTSYDTSTLKLKNATGDMWERFEKYLNEGRYEVAEQERIDKLNNKFATSGEQIRLSDYMGIDREFTHSTVSFYSGPNAVEVERKEFLKIADYIILEKIETQNVQIEDWHGIYLSVAENQEFAFISSDGKVSRKNPSLSLVLPAEYVIKASDIDKLYSLLPDEAKENLPPLKSLYANFINWFIWNPTEVRIIGALIFVVLISVVGFVIGYTITKKKRNSK